MLGVRQRSPASSYWQGRAGHPRGLCSPLQRSNGSSLWPDIKPVHAEPSKLLSSSSIRAGQTCSTQQLGTPAAEPESGCYTICSFDLFSPCLTSACWTADACCDISAGLQQLVHALRRPSKERLDACA